MSRQRRGAIARVVRSAVAFTLFAACASWGRPRASSEIFPEPARDADCAMRLYFTGDTEGSLGPCGCETDQYGGLPRRATYLKRVKREGDLAIDLGNLVAGESLTHELTMRYALDGLAAVGYDAIVPAEAEVRLGAAFEEALAARPALTAISANLLRANDGSRVFEPWKIRKLSDGRSVAVVGVCEPFPQVPAAYRITPLRETVRDAVRELRGKADAIVVAGGLREDTTRALAAECPEVTLVVGGWSREGSRDVVRTAGAPALLVGQFAWYVAHADLSKALTVLDSDQAWLDEAVPDDPDMSALVARFKAEMSEEGAGFAEKLVGTLRAQSYVGSESCGECHGSEYRVWKESGHAHGMRTLVAKNAASDPQCIPCHLVDVPANAAAPPATDELGIGCEACHGGGARHEELALAGSRDMNRALAPATKATCLRCHSPPNDTHFDFERHWPKIAHGRSKDR